MNPVMMRRLATTVIVVSVVGAILLVSMLLKRGQAPGIAAEAAPVPVVVANTAVHAKEPLSSYSGKFHVVTKPKDQVPDDAVQKLEDLDGKYALANIETGALVKKSQVGAKEQLGTIASLLRPGYLAMTVPADRLSILNGALKPEDSVDVLVSADINGKTVSYMVLRNIRVLQVGSETAQTRPAAQTSGQPAPAAAEPPASTYVTVEVRQDQVSRLSLAVSKGHIQLVLRGVGSGINPDVAVPVATTDQIFPTGADKKAAPAPRRSAGTRMANRSEGYPPGLPPAAPVGYGSLSGPATNPLPPAHVPLPPASTARQIFVIRGGTQETVTIPGP